MNFGRFYLEYRYIYIVYYIYSLDPPLRNLRIKKTGVVQRPGGPKKNPAEAWRA